MIRQFHLWKARLSPVSHDEFIYKRSEWIDEGAPWQIPVLDYQVVVSVSKLVRPFPTWNRLLSHHCGWMSSSGFGYSSPWRDSRDWQRNPRKKEPKRYLSVCRTWFMSGCSIVSLSCTSQFWLWFAWQGNKNSYWTNERIQPVTSSLPFSFSNNDTTIN